MNTNTEILQKNTSKPNSTAHCIIHHDQVRFIYFQDAKLGRCTKINQCTILREWRTKNFIIISTGPEKAFDKIQYLFMIKTLNKVRIAGKYLNITKATWEKPTANTILNGKKLKSFPFKIRNKARMPALTSIQHSIRNPA